MTDIEVTDRRSPNESAILDESSLDPKYKYRFVQVRPAQVARAKLKGYRIVKPSQTNERTLLDQEDTPAEDVIQHGDRVLMRAPMAKHRENRERVRERTRNRLKSADQKARDLMRQSGVRTYEKYGETKSEEEE